MDHGDVATAGASATTVDLCLTQVRRAHGAVNLRRRFHTALNTALNTTPAAYRRSFR